MASIDEKIADLKTKITQPKLEDPRLDFKPDGRFFRVLPGNVATWIGEKFIPWSRTTPVGRTARLPKDFVGHPLQIAFGWIRWTDTVTYRYQLKRASPIRDTPLLLADAIADRERGGFRIIGPVTANRLIVRWIEKNGGAATLSDGGELSTNFFPYERIDSLAVGRFIGKNAHLARAFEIASADTSRGLEILLGETPKPIRHNGTITDRELDYDQKNAVRAVLDGKSIVIHGAPGCGKTRAIAAIANAISKSDKIVAVASPVAGAIASIERMVDNPSVEIIDLSKGETATKDVALMIIDEASSITPLQAAPLAARAKQLVIVGDAQQSPPLATLPRIDGEESLMTWALSLPTFDKYKLTHHYRSPHCEVIDLSNMYFYNASIKMVPASSWRPLDKTHFHELNSAPYNGPIHKDEAARVIEIIRRIRLADATRTILAVTMNLKQRDEIKNRINALGPDYSDIKTVYVRDAQGNEADDVIVSLVPGTKSGANNHPLSFEERFFNVAFSRARLSTHAVLGAPINADLPAILHCYCHLIRISVQSAYQLKDPIEEIRFAKKRYSADEVMACNFGTVVGISPIGSHHWEAGFAFPRRSYLTMAENDAMKQMLITKGWNLLS